MQGSGLGLSICQLIVERFGGEIWINTEYKDGSRFVFTHLSPTPPQITRRQNYEKATYHTVFHLTNAARLEQQPCNVHNRQLLTVLSALPHDTTRLKTLHQIILTSQDNSTGTQYAQQLYKEAKLQNNKLYICDGAYFQTLYYYNNDGEQDSISKWVNLLKPIAQSIQYWKVYFNSQKLLINTYVYNNQYEYAFNEASKMLEKSPKYKECDRRGLSYQCLANIYHETNRRKR